MTVKNYERRKAESERNQRVEGQCVWQMDIAVSHQCQREMRTCTTSLTVKAGWCPAEDGPLDSRHMPLHSSYSEGAHRMKSWKLLQLITLQLSLDRLYRSERKNKTAMHWGELLYPVVSPAVGYHFWWPHKRDITKVKILLVWQMHAIEIKQNGSWFHV